MEQSGPQAGWRAAWIGILLVAMAPARADSVLADFNSATVGSCNPRAGWSAFGAGTTDRGVTADGSIGRGAYHTIDWASSTWGIGDIAVQAVDLSGFATVRVDARMVGLSGHTGTPRLRFALDLPGDTEFSSASVTLGSTYATYEFDLATLTRTAGSGSLDLTSGTPKLIADKNGQAGTARLDFDEIVAVSGGGGGYTLMPVTLRPPPDGDAVRAMWFYAGSTFESQSASQAVLDFCAREGVNRVYCDAYGVWGSAGNEEEKTNLRTFIAACHASGIRIEALVGEANWPFHPEIVVLRLSQILALHAATPGDAADDYDAIHFDVEFWTDASTWSGTESQRQQVARKYFDDVLAEAREYLDENGAPGVDIAVDLSTHLDQPDMLPSAFTYNGVTQYFLEHTLDLVDDVALMSYYDMAGTIATVAGPELDLAAGKNRRIQLGADIYYVPPEHPNNSFADDYEPTPNSVMTKTLEEFHVRLSAPRLAALDGFSVFEYESWASYALDPGNIADWDGDGDVGLSDYTSWVAHMAGPGIEVQGVARDADLTGDGNVDLADWAVLAVCFTGEDAGDPVPPGCER
ncbi:MAG: hypothetical protein JXB13_12070 [Phycisphaerae bacterium]|nr:hypothetical protein [Phycisphaerae bacterium]